MLVELLILGAGFALVAYNIPVKGAPFRYSNLPGPMFAQNREGWAQPTRDAQKRRDPVVPRAQGNAFNDAPLNVVTRSNSNEVFTDAFRVRYMDMLKSNRLRPAPSLDRFWQSTSSHMQQTVGNGYQGKASAQSTLNTKLPYSFTTDYVPSLYAGALSSFKK